MNTDGTSIVRLTNNTAADNTPQFSPDGSKIVFVSDRDGNQEVYVMDADGSGVVRVTNDPGVDNSATFSPDGARLAFVSNRGGQTDVYTVNLGGSGLVRLTNTAAVEAVWQWRSPSVPLPQSVATVQVTPSSSTLASVGQTVQLNATARDASGNTIAGKTFTWSTSDPGVATVSSSGLVTAVAGGDATITATSDGVSG